MTLKIQQTLKVQQADPRFGRMLRKSAVQFGDSPRFDSSKAFPFFYSFIAYPYQFGNVNQTTGEYEITTAEADGPDGLLVAANGGIREIPIVMDEDANFHLLSIRYGAWNPTIVAPNGSRARLLAPANSLQGGRSLFQAEMNQMDFYSTYLSVSVYMTSSGGRDLYGGMQRNPITGAQDEQPIPVQATQGVQDGCGSLRTAFQLPKQATVRIRVVNKFSQDLRVYGHLFGYKITV